MEMKILRMNLLGGMDDYICNHLGYEEACENWYRIVPQGHTEYLLEFIAEDEELWVMACDLFGQLVKEYDE